MHFEDWMELVVKGFEVAGVVILAVGSLAALTNAAIALSRGDRRGRIRRRSAERRSSRLARARGPDHRRHRADDHD